MKKIKHQEEDDRFVQTIKARSKELENIDMLISQGRIKFFNKNQIEEYLYQLKDCADRRSILNFIDGLDFYCLEYSQNAKHLKPGQRKKRREDFSSLIQDARSVVARLKRISTRKDVVAYPSELQGLAFMEDRYDENGNYKPEAFINKSISQAITRAVLPLEELINTLENANEIMNPSNPRGREESDWIGLIKIIAMFYGRYIGKPKPSLESEFFTVVKLTLNYLDPPGKDGEKHKDPSRLVKKALKSYKPSPLDKA